LPETEFKLDAKMRLGPLSLKIKDPNAMLEFYEKNLGFRVTRSEGNSYHLAANHETQPILVLGNDEKAEPAPRQSAGLYHFALLVPDRRSLADVYVSVGNAGVIFDGYADHLVSEALYLTDPEGNGIEIYADKPRSEWTFSEDGQVKMATEPLDIDSLLKERVGGITSGPPSLPTGTRMGHVHLKVTNLEQSIAFYQGMLGLNLMSFWGSAAFLSVGGYHHHIGMNTWESLHGEPTKPQYEGLEYFTITISEENLKQLSERLADSPFLNSQVLGQLFISDPDGIEIIVKASS
jgi:catechol 2,3-dioxygenase